MGKAERREERKGKEEQRDQENSEERQNPGEPSPGKVLEAA